MLYISEYMIHKIIDKILLQIVIYCLREARSLETRFYRQTVLRGSCIYAHSH